MKVLELFAGTRSIGKAFEAKGHEVYSVEWDKNFEDIDLYDDVLKVTAEQIIRDFGHPDVIWASPDCTTYSVAAISKHRRKEANGNLTPISDYAAYCDTVNTHVVDLIKELNPTYYFIENPVGGLRKMDFMADLPRYTVTYCQYGECRQKPSDIWTNHPNPQFKEPCKRGAKCHDAAPRGSRTGTQALKNAVEKSKIPVMLCEHVVEICEEEYRICTACGEPMQEGYCINDGDEYFCTDDCLHSYYSEEEYAALCEDDCAYWTQWY